MKIETGVMVINSEGKAWACIYSDGRETNYGWVRREEGDMFDEKYIKTAGDVIWKGHSRYKEVSRASVVRVERRIEVIVKG